MRAALAALVTLSSIDVVAGGIVLTFSEKTALVPYQSNLVILRTDLVK